MDRPMRIQFRPAGARHGAAGPGICISSARWSRRPSDAAQTAAIAQVLDETAHRLGDNYPYFHPLYAGQMLKPPHPVARAAYALAMTINPNNHARDGGRASSAMEIEAVAGIAAMFGWTGSQLPRAPDLQRNHSPTSKRSGSPGRLAPGQRILGSDQAHYTHQRISAVLKLPYRQRGNRRPGPNVPGSAGGANCARATWGRSS